MITQGVVTALFALVLSIASVVAGNGYATVARRMRKYKSAPGKVLTREVAIAGNGMQREGRFGNGGRYMAKVRYRYSVGGTAYESDQMAYAYRGLRKELAEKELAAIPEDVTVWYNPEKPEEAYLTKHSPTLGYVIMGSGAFAAMCCVFYLLARFK